MKQIIRNHKSEGVLIETDLGLLPSEWRIVPLGEILDFQNGVNAAAKDYGRGIRFANVLEVITHSHLHAPQIPGRVTLPSSSIGTFQVKHGDILFNRTSETQDELGMAAAYVDQEPIVFGGFVIRARQRAAKLHPAYAGYALRTPIVRRQIIAAGQGAVRANIGQQSLSNVLIPLPDEREQKLIAESLSEADALIRSLEVLIAKKSAIKKGVMQVLLSGHERLPGFTRTWEQKTFGEIFDFHPTATNSRADLYSGGNVAYIHYGDIHTRFHSHLDFSKVNTPRIDREKCRNAATLKNGDWIMADASEDYDGLCKSVEVKGLSEGEVAVSGLHTFLLREKISTFAPGFKGHLGNSYTLRRQLLRVMTGMKVYGVSKAALGDLILDVPEIGEQEAIRDILDDLNDELDALTVRLGKTRQLKQAMTQDLLTGRVRLV